MRKKLIFSLDYDGSACILFTNAIEEGRFGESMPFYAKQKICLDSARKVLNEFIQNTISDISGKIELYVGSARQCRFSDKSNSGLNGNGRCFTNYAALAEEKGWTFRKLLLADIKDDKTVRRPGTAMGPLRKNEKGTYEYVADTDADAALAPDDSKKIKLLSIQLRDTAKNNPDEKIEFIFIDDDIHIIEALKEYFITKENACLIPKNITLRLVQYNWLPLVKKYREQCDLEENEFYPIFKAALQEKFVFGSALSTLNNETKHQPLVQQEKNKNALFVVKHRNPFAKNPTLAQKPNYKDHDSNSSQYNLIR